MNNNDYEKYFEKIKLPEKALHFKEISSEYLCLTMETPAMGMHLTSYSQNCWQMRKNPDTVSRLKSTAWLYYIVIDQKFAILNSTDYT